MNEHNAEMERRDQESRAYAREPERIESDGIIRMRGSDRPHHSIAIMDIEGTVLLGINISLDGTLDVEGPEERWSEACKRFVEEIRRLAGSVPSPEPVSGHELWREIIAKHGVDRCPTVIGQWRKVLEELGELIEAITDDGQGDLSPSDVIEHIRKEYADTGLALYGLGSKLGMDLDLEMERVVKNETRRFT